MTQDEAFKKACSVWGDAAVAGRNWNYPEKSFHVGKRERGVWIYRGVGATFEEAFANVVEYPDGKKPPTVNL